MLIPDHLWAQMTEDEQRLVKETMQGLRRRGREITCPHCAKTIRILTTLSARAYDEDEPLDQETPTPPPAPRSVIDQRVLEAVRASGLLDAFAHTVRAEKEFSGVPADLDSFFLLFVRSLTPTKVSAITLATWIQEFGGFIEVWQAHGILAVISDGALVAFVPNRYTEPTPITGTGPRPKVSTTANFERWTKSKFGYVPVGARHFGEALKQRNVGKFGGIVQ